MTSQQQADAVLEGAAVLVVAVVRQRRQELVQQITVRGVDLGELEARRQRAPRRAGEVVDHVLEFAVVQRARQRRGFAEGDAPTARPASSRRRTASPRFRPATAARRWPCGRRARAGCRAPRPGRRRSARSATSASACSSFQRPVSAGRDAAFGRHRGGLGDDQRRRRRRRGCPGGRGASRWARRPTAEYWHIGDTTRRLRRVSERCSKGAKSRDTADSCRAIAGMHEWCGRLPSRAAPSMGCCIPPPWHHRRMPVPTAHTLASALLDLPAAPLCVGYSGGLDSTVLLHAAGGRAGPRSAACARSTSTMACTPMPTAGPRIANAPARHSAFRWRSSA